MQRIYSTNIRLIWGESKRRRNRLEHSLDFADTAAVFAGPTFTFEDDRFACGEGGFVTLGLLSGIPVSVVHTETTHEIRIISFRKATTREAAIFFEGFQK
jgi:uncharacterized protein